MIVTRLRWLMALGLTLTLSGVLRAQQPLVWRSAGAKPATPIATIGKPVPIARPTVAARPGAPIIRARAADEDFRRPAPPPTADPNLSDAAPSAGGAEPGITIPLDLDVMVRIKEAGVGTAPPQPSPPPETHAADFQPGDVPPPPVSPFPSADVSPGVATDRSVSPSFWDRCVDAVTLGDKGHTHGRHPFGSDNCFPGMISPITMPNYFEDPRSLTEIRPIFTYQAIPDGNPNTRGGDAIYFGTQLRLSITDRLSFVVNQLGFLSIGPDITNNGFTSDTGFAELRLGPKWTFLRNTDTGTVGAVGLTFEVPVGSKGVFQDTGELSLAPYFSIGQSVNLGGGWGSLNFLGTTGYSFSVNNARAEFFYLNFHVDYNIAGLNTIFPVFEVNWIHYGNTPDSQPFNFEGAHQINFGSSLRTTSDYLSLAPGLRYRFTENVFAGTAVELPVLTEKGFADYRFLFDVIFRF